MPATVLEGPLGAPEKVIPELRIRYGTSSKYAPLELSQCGDIDDVIATIRFDTMPGSANPDQFVLVIGQGLGVIPLNLSGPELRLTLGAQAVNDLYLRAERRTGRGIASEKRFGYLDEGCNELVIGYQVLGRTTSAGRTTAERTVGRAPSQAPQATPSGVFDGNFAPAFLEIDGEMVLAPAPATRYAEPAGDQREVGPQPGDWIEYMHGPMTFTCCFDRVPGEMWREIKAPPSGGTPPISPGRLGVPPQMSAGFWSPNRAYKRGEVVFMTNPKTGQTKIYGAVCDIPAGSMSPDTAVAQQTGQAVPDGQVPDHGQQAQSQNAPAPAGP